MPDVRSVALGFWIDVGSRDESLELGGVSHFLEHLLFKGTERWTARQIAEAVEAVGGEMNAFTTKEYTAFYTRVLDEDLDLGLDILCDIMSAPAFRPEEIEAERQVILEEILMHEDEPADLVHDLFTEALYPDHPLGREVLGTAQSISAMSRDAIAGHFSAHYRPRNLVLAAAGHLDHDGVADHELDLAKGHWKGSLALALEDSGGRMNRVGRSELVHNEVLTVSELVERTEAVTQDDVRRVAERVLANERVVALVGPFEEEALTEMALTSSVTSA